MRTMNEGGIKISKARDNLIEKWVYFVNVCNFTFQFASIEQIEECKQYFEKKIHPSTRGYHPPYEHYWHHWYSKLPKGITKLGKRKKVIKQLEKALEVWSK